MWAVQLWSKRNSRSRDGSQTNRERGRAANVTSKGVYGEVTLPRAVRNTRRRETNTTLADVRSHALAYSAKLIERCRDGVGDQGAEEASWDQF